MKSPLSHQIHLCCVALTVVLATPVYAAHNQTELSQELLMRAQMWQERYRDDLALEELTRLLRMTPNHPEALAQLALAQNRMGKRTAAESTLAQLRQYAPQHPAISQIEFALRLQNTSPNNWQQASQLATQVRQQLNQLHFLTGTARKTEEKNIELRISAALALLKAITPNEALTGDLALLYWQISGMSDKRWVNTQQGLSKLVAQDPNNQRYKLALAEHLVSRSNGVTPTVLQTLSTLSLIPAYAKPARNAWRRGLLNLPHRASSLPLLAEYLRQDPNDSTVHTRYQQIQQQLIAYKTLINSPIYKITKASEQLLAENRLSEGEFGLWYLRQGQHQTAESYFRQAQKRAPIDEQDKWQSLATTAQYWKLIQQAKQAEKLGDLLQAEQCLQQARQLNAQEPNGLAHLADIYATQGKLSLAEQTYLTALKIEPKLEQALHGIIRLCVDSQRYADADKFLPHLPTDAQQRWQANIQRQRATQLAQQAEQAQQTGDLLLAQQQWEQTISLDPQNPWARLSLAKIYQQQGHAQQARELFQIFIQDKAPSAEALYAYALLLASQAQNTEALSILARIPEAQRDNKVKQLQRRVWLDQQFAELEQLHVAAQTDANQMEALDQKLTQLMTQPLDEPQQQQLNQIKQAAILRHANRLQQTQGNESAIQYIDKQDEQHPELLAYAAQLAEQGRQLQRAQSYYQQALKISNHTTPAYLQQRYSTKQQTLLEQTRPWFAAGFDSRHRNATAGLSSLSAQELTLEWKHAWHQQGQWIARADVVQLNAGTLAANELDFGTRSAIKQPYQALDQQAQGIAFNVSWNQPNLRLDLGTSPIGFPVQNILGGLLYQAEWSSYNYSINLSRRPVTSTLLSYAGTKDEATGDIWGGVTETGARLGVSRDDGGKFGMWGQAALSQLTGRNVQNNTHQQWMGGGYWRIINQEDQLLSIGTTVRFEQFSHNAGEYSFGHGGYYSPEQVLSISLPIRYGQRIDHWSYLIRGALSSSWSSSAQAPYFPTNETLQQSSQLYHSASRNKQSIGYALEGSLEYKIDPKLYLGARVELERSPDYAPNRALVYLRYALGNEPSKPVFFPPNPIIPTSRF